MALTSFEKEGFSNILSLLIFFLLLFAIFYASYISIQRIFPKKECSTDLKPETFVNLLSLNDVIYNTDFSNEPPVRIAHAKRHEVAERREEEPREKKNEAPQPIQQKPSNIYAYVIEKGRNKYHLLDDQKSLLFTVDGYKDPQWIHQIKSAQRKEITMIKNKMYNKYEFLYKTKSDSEIQPYVIEYRSSQSRFLKIYDSRDEHIFYLEKIEYKEDKDQFNRTPLYRIYDYAEEVGKIYLDESEKPEDRTYICVLSETRKDDQHILLFGFSLYLSLYYDSE